MKEKEGRVLIFDFDGTIVDSKKVYYNALEKHLGHLGFGKKKADKLIDLGLSITETLKNIGVSPVLRWWEKRAIMKEVIKEVKKVKECRDVEDVKKLVGKKILISNSLSEFIFPVLRHLKIEDEFDEIYGADAFDNKEEFIGEYIRRNGIDKKNCYYVGDRRADVKLARSLGIVSVALSTKCSWNSRSEMLKEKPDFMIFDLANLKEILG